jgi:hypothetical protein
MPLARRRKYQYADVQDGEASSVRVKPHSRRTRWVMVLQRRERASWTRGAALRAKGVTKRGPGGHGDETACYCNRMWVQRHEGREEQAVEPRGWTEWARPEENRARPIRSAHWARRTGIAPVRGRYAAGTAAGRRGAWCGGDDKDQDDVCWSGRGRSCRRQKRCPEVG